MSYIPPRVITENDGSTGEKVHIKYESGFVAFVNGHGFIAERQGTWSFVQDATMAHRFTYPDHADGVVGNLKRQHGMQPTVGYHVFASAWNDRE